MAYILQIISPLMDIQRKAFATLVSQTIVYYVFCDNLL